MAIRRQRCETVAEMLRDRWEVISHCEHCGLIMTVNLRLVARVSGPSTSLWNRKIRCRRLGCTGFVGFQAKAPGMDCFDALAAPWPGGKLPKPADGA
jgi:hypothetical protein